MSILIKNAQLVNEDKTYFASVLVNNKRIESIITGDDLPEADKVIDAHGKLLIPGLIDDQVHFREPGLTEKAEIATESRAAVAGGITSYMEMPNTVPQAVTVELLEEKYNRAAEVSAANYSFFLGTTNYNLEELLKLDEKKVCGVKIFMGSSTGDMVVDDAKALEEVFANVKTLIATHCEDDPMIKANTKKAIEKYGDAIPMSEHPHIRSREACYKSSSFAVGLAKKHGTRLHILHISSKEELDLFENDKPLEDKHITSEACVHHMWFGGKEDYEKFGSRIKWNPAVKEKSDAEAILQAVIDDRIDVIATDHAPHTKEEKSGAYLKAPSGGPLVQHALLAMLEFWKDQKITLTKIVEKMCHNPAKMFAIEERGFIREGYYADLVLVDPNAKTKVEEKELLYKCGWSPFEGYEFNNAVAMTMVNGEVMWDGEKVTDKNAGMRLTFDR